ncbi:SDR family oxidoreductase, partial [uncultured Helicobacter sp.]|uniref:SDR family oxidoreductase n=1 Tax=uncultured Helicobacter sp. TaxID=175537 RepID=UPI002634DF83
AKERLIDTLHFYFDNELDNFIGNRIVILKGDITKENFGLSNEIYDDIKDAIAREKQIKAGSRQKKLDLIESFNPRWEDLYESLL